MYKIHKKESSWFNIFYIKSGIDKAVTFIERMITIPTRWYYYNKFFYGEIIV